MVITRHRLFAILLLLSSAFPSAHAERPPNVILVLADDLGWAELGCYGNPFNETPHLDAMAKRGMLFTQAYAAAPVCSPFRVSLMTGQYPARSGITDYLRPNDNKHLDPALTTMPELFKQAGYVTGMLGKWHLTGYQNHGAEEFPPTVQGFDEAIITENRGIGGGSYFHPYHFNREIEKRLPDREHLVDRMNLEAVEFIDRHKDNPFFLYKSHYAVHTRMIGREDLVKKYQAKLDTGKFNRKPGYNVHLAAQLELIDTGVGMIVDALKQHGLLDHTLLIFTSDNGGEVRVTSNAPLRGAKSQLYEGGIRECFIARWPGRIPEDSVCDTPITSVDHFPTFAELLGQTGPKAQPVDGTSILSLFKNPASVLNRDTLYWHYPLHKPHFLGGVSGGAIREGDFKLIEFFTDNRVELYNLKEDIGETRDLAQAHPDKAKTLREKLATWRKDVGAEVYGHTAPAPKKKTARTGKATKLNLFGKTLTFQAHGAEVNQKVIRLNGKNAYLDLPRELAPPVANRSISIRAQVVSESPNGVVVAHGGDRTGYALYIKDGRPTFTVCSDWKRTTIAGPKTITKATLFAQLDNSGKMILKVDGNEVAEGESQAALPTNPGDSLQIGADSIKQVGHYKGENFFKGTIEDLAIETK